jgi:hypothetical protein
MMVRTWDSHAMSADRKPQSLKRKEDQFSLLADRHIKVHSKIESNADKKHLDIIVLP